MTTDTNKQHNVQSPVNTIINGVMRDATTADNRQAELTVAMFNSEVTYSSEAIANVFRKEGTERTTAIDDMLCDASAEFDHIAAQYDHAVESKKAAKKADSKSEEERLKFTIEGYNKKMRAARIMFTRALSSVYWLRQNNCQTIATNKIGSGALSIKIQDMDDKEESFIKEKVSCTLLARRGDDALRKLTGKTRQRQQTARNPSANVVADASKSLAAVLVNMNTDGHYKPMVDFDDSVEANLEATLINLFGMKFADDKGKLDRKAVNEWIANTFEAKKPAQEQKPEQKPTEQEQKTA